MNLIRKDDDANPQERLIVDRLRYPEYMKPSEYHDLALLRMETPVRFDAYVRPACLPIVKRIEGSQAVATGWGRVDWSECIYVNYIIYNIVCMCMCACMRL